MRRKKSYGIGNIGDLYFIHDEEPSDFPAANEMLTTNESGAFLWEQLEQEISLEDLSGRLAGYYEIDTESALQDVSAFLAQLRGIGAIETN